MFGVTQMFRGLRRDNTALAVGGAFVLLVGLLRKYGGRRTTLVHAEELNVGSELSVRVVPGQATR